MKVGEVGFVIKLADGTYEGRRTRRGDNPYTRWSDADHRLSRHRLNAPSSTKYVDAKVVPVILQPVEVL